jgi:transcriptional regulator with GAF, ATPase, and Fis domain
MKLLARAIHTGSPRNSWLFVPGNCRAIPLELVGSEVFWHIK